MDEPINQRMSATAEDGVVVFLIGMRLNRLRRIGRWLPVLRAMPQMLRELEAHRELGLLSYRALLSSPRELAVLQYWKSSAHLLAYAHDRERAHLPAWQAFNRSVGTSGDVGIWHETYVVPPGHGESIYVNMPRYGLGRAFDLHPATGERASAARRLSVR